MRQAGFTLIELLVAGSVLAIVMGLGAPSVSRAVERVRTANAMHELTAALALARMEAIRRNRPVTVCPSLDGRTCRGGPDWTSGWLVFVDARRSGQPGSSDAVIRQSDAPSGLQIRATAGRRHVRFNPGGWSPGSNVSLRACSADGDRWLGSVIVNNAGRSRVERAPGDRAAPCPFAAAG